MPGTENDLHGWYTNRPVEKGQTAFWLDRGKHPHMGDPQSGDTVWRRYPTGKCRLLQKAVRNPSTSMVAEVASCLSGGQMKKPGQSIDRPGYFTGLCR